MQNKKRFPIPFFDFVFLVLFLSSILTLLLRPELYRRPWEYFVLTSLTISSVALEIVCTPRLENRTLRVLSKIILVAAGLRFIPQFLYPGLVGIDPWWHQMFTTKIMDLGRIPAGYGYSDLPFFHLIVALTSAITGLDYKFSVMASVGLSNVISLVFIFLIGKRLYNVKAGLLAALTAGIADWYINTGFWTIPNTLGTAFMIMLIYLIFKPKSSFTSRFFLLELIFSGTIIMTHALSSLAMALLLACFLLGQFLFSKILGGIDKERLVSIAFTGLFATAMFAYWDYISGSLFSIANGVKHVLRLEHLIAPEVTVQYRYGNFSEFLLGATGILLFYSISMVGVLLSFRKATKQSIALAFGGVAVSAIALSGYAFSLSALYPQRWFLYSQPIMAIFVAIGLLSIGKLVRNYRRMAILTLSVVLVLSFFTISSPLSNVDSPIYTPNLTVRFFYYESEMKAAEAIQSMYAGTVFTDGYYGSYLGENFGGKVESFSKQIVTGNFTNTDSIAIRDSITREPFYVSGYLGVYKLDYDVISTIEGLEYDRVYDSGTVFFYVHP